MSLTDKFNTFHTFSKTPVTDSADFSLAVNASGHTVQDGDVLASKLPFYSREQFNSIAEAHEKLGSSTVENDLVSVVENGVETVYTRNAAGYSVNVPDNWSRLPVEGGLPDGYELRNREGTVVAVFHKSQPLEAVTYGNNSKAGSESAGGGHLAGRLKVDGKHIPFFLDVTNCERNGYPALGYKPLVECAPQEIYPSGNGKDFWVSSSSGMVVFEEVNGKGRDFESGTGRLGPITISCFEYKGLKLDEKFDEAVEAVGTSLNQLNAKINAETSRATAAEEALDGRLTDAEGNIATLQGWAPSIFGNGPGAIEGRLKIAEGTLQSWGSSIFGSGPESLEGRITAAEGTIEVFGNNFNTVFGWGPSIFGNGPDSLEGRITAAEGDIVSLQGTVGQHTADISGLRAALAAEKARAMGVEEGLGERLETAEGAIAVNAGAIADIKDEIGESTSQGDDIYGKINKLRSDLGTSTAAAGTGSAFARIHQAENDITALEGDVAAIEVEIGPSTSRDESTVYGKINNEVQARTQKDDEHDASILTINASVSTLNASVFNFGPRIKATEDAVGKRTDSENIDIEGVTETPATVFAALKYFKKHLPEIRYIVRQASEGLPEPASDYPRTLVLLHKGTGGEGDNIFTEYLSVSKDDGATWKWEKLGEAGLDLSNVVSKAELQEEAQARVQGDQAANAYTDQEVEKEKNRAVAQESSIQNQVNYLNDSVFAFGPKVDALETLTEVLDSRMDAAEGDITTLQSDLSTLSGTVESQGNAIITLQTTVAGHGTDITQLRTDLDQESSTRSQKDTEHDTAISVLQGTVAGHDSRIAEIESDYATQTYVDTQDASTLASAKTYADTKNIPFTDGNDGTPSGVPLKGLKVQGSYVAVVEDTDHPGNFTLLIRENKDNPPYASIAKTNPSNEPKYIYGPVSGEFGMPGDTASDSQYARCIPLAGSVLKMTLMGSKGTDAIIAKSKTEVLKVEILTRGTAYQLYSEMVKDISLSSVATAAVNVYCDTYKEIEDADVEEGYTKDTVQLTGVKVELKMDDSDLHLLNGGAAKIRVTLGSIAKETDEFFFYKAKTPTYQGTLTASVSNDHLRYVSGVPYRTTGTVVTLNGVTFNDTCHYATTSKEKVVVNASSIAGGTQKINAPANSNIASPVAVTNVVCTMGSGIAYSETKNIYAYAADKTSVSASVYAAGPFWSKTGAPTATTEDFQGEIDGAAANNRLKPDDWSAWTSTESRTLPADALRVRGGKLLYPTESKTGNRTYCRIFRGEGGSELAEFDITVEGITAFNDPKLTISCLDTGNTEYFINRKGGNYDMAQGDITGGKWHCQWPSSASKPTKGEGIRVKITMTEDCTTQLGPIAFEF